MHHYSTNICQFNDKIYILFAVNVLLFEFGATACHWAMVSSFKMFLVHTQRRASIGRTSLDEWSARLRDLYLTTHKTHNRHPCHRWDSNPNLSRLAAADLRLRPRGLWDQRECVSNLHKFNFIRNFGKNTVQITTIYFCSLFCLPAWVQRQMGQHYLCITTAVETVVFLYTSICKFIL